MRSCEMECSWDIVEVQSFRMECIWGIAKNPTGTQSYRWDFFRMQGEKIPSVTSLRLVFRAQ